MFGLRIIDPTYWRDSWSVKIGQSLDILNSTYNLFVFDAKTRREEILMALQDVPPEAYALIRIHPCNSGACHISTDSGQCYEQD